MAKTTFESSLYLADGCILETEIYFNDTVDSIIIRLNQWKDQYKEYDFLNLENNNGNGYCLIGYIRKVKEHDIIILNCGVPHTPLRAGDIGTIIHIYGDNSYEIEFIKDEVSIIKTLKPIEFTKRG